MILHEWIVFIARFWISTEVVYLQRWHGWCHKNLLPESQSRRVLCTPYNHAPCHFMQSHIRKVYACLAVTCHLCFWQDDRGLLRATVVTRGWNGYRNKSQHRKLTLEKKILPPPQQGFEPATFRSRVRSSNHWAIPAPWFSLLMSVHSTPPPQKKYMMLVIYTSLPTELWTINLTIEIITSVLYKISPLTLLQTLQPKPFKK